MPFNPRWIVGKTILAVDMRPFNAADKDHRPRTAHAPIIMFTDGSELRFVGEETDFGEYGVGFIYYPAKSVLYHPPPIVPGPVTTRRRPP